MTGDAGDQLPKPEPIDFGALYAKVQENRRRLDGCPRHLFPAAVPGIEGGVAAMMGRKIECERCKGQMDLVALNFYIRGYEAAGKSGNDILPGWRSDEPQRRYFGQAVEGQGDPT